IGRDLDGKAFSKFRGNRFAQGEDADRGRVAVVAVAQRFDCRFDDKTGGMEICLADAEIDDVAPLRGKLHGPRQNGKRIFFADTVKRRDGLEHGSSPRNLAALQPNRTGNANTCEGSAGGCAMADWTPEHHVILLHYQALAMD